MGLGITEVVYLIAAVLSAVWVFIDAPKFKINPYVAVAITLLVIYPVGFILYLVVSRMRKKA